MKMLLCLLTFFGFQPAFADASYKQFKSYLEHDRGQIVSEINAQEILRVGSGGVSIEPELYEQLRQFAISQAEIWGDTVLEGDVAAVGDIELVSAEVLRAKGELLGYRITYAQRGWDTSTCDLSNATSEDYQKPETFAHCAEGRIIESAYVTADLDNSFADYDNLAHLELSVR